MKRAKNKPLKALLLVVATAIAALATPASVAFANDIEYVVNNAPVTTYDIQRRMAFMRLQRRSASHKAAADEMINQTLRLQEMARLNIDVPESAVDDAYANFAGKNNISTSQLNQALAQAGVTTQHFKTFVRSQIGWSRVLQARFQANDKENEQDAVQRMLKQGGKKPSATEYMLQQVIFVIPNGEKGQILGRRQREARAMRDRFQNCDNTRQFAKGLIDVTVRDLGRVLEPALPSDWKGDITKLSPGQATPIRTTDRGVEFIGVCSSREVSDDRVATMVFESQKSDNEVAGKMTEKYMKELRDKAAIVER